MLDNAPPSRAVETALSSPQSQHVRRCVPRGLTARLASPLPTHLLRICAGALYRRAQCAVSKFAGGKKPAGLLARIRLLTPEEEAIMRFGFNNPSVLPSASHLLAREREALLSDISLFIIRRLPQSRSARQLPQGRSQGSYRLPRFLIFFREEGSPPLRRSGANYASRCVPRGFAPMLAAPLPVKLAARFLREPFS